MAESALAAHTGGELLDHLEIGMHHRDDDHLGNAFSGLYGKGFLAAVPDGNEHLALVVRVDQADQVAKHDAVLVTQLLGGESSFKARDRRPESTYNIRPTYYYNVCNVELAEYSEPKGLEAEHGLTMATQVFSVSTKEPVWTIETRSKLKRNIDQQFSGTSVAAEAKAIVGAMSRDGLLAR